MSLLLRRLCSQIANYNPKAPVYSRGEFTERCSPEEIFSNPTPNLHRQLRCDATHLYGNSSSVQHLYNWTLSDNGFHTTIHIVNREPIPSDCYFAVFAPSESFFDILEAADREFHSPQPPMIHFLPATTTTYNVQHRYPNLQSDGYSDILAPGLLCPNGKEYRFQPPGDTFLTRIRLPIPTVHYANVIHFTTLASPIIAVLVLCKVMFFS
jgi:hypothetical protein